MESSIEKMKPYQEKYNKLMALIQLNLYDPTIERQEEIKQLAKEIWGNDNNNNKG